MATTVQPIMDFYTVISESKRIINAHSRHFLALSVLFLLPLSFSLSVFPTLPRSPRLTLFHASSRVGPALLCIGLPYYSRSVATDPRLTQLDVPPKTLASSKAGPAFPSVGLPDYSRPVAADPRLTQFEVPHKTLVSSRAEPTLLSIGLPDNSRPVYGASSAAFPGPRLSQFEVSYKTLIFSLLFAACFVVLSLCAVGSVTYSVFHGFYGRPVKLGAAIRSLFSSFFPLLFTVVTAQFVVFAVFALFVVYEYVGIKVIELIGVENVYNSPHFIGVSLIGAVILVFGVIYLEVNWALASVVAVVESKWGVTPLVRSKNLMIGMRWVGLNLIMFFGFLGVALLLVDELAINNGSDTGIEGWKSWAFVLQIVVTSAILTLLLLQSIAASTVLYMYCRALHGELAGEIANEFAAEYVSLPFDDKKLPHVVCVLH